MDKPLLRKPPDRDLPGQVPHFGPIGGLDRPGRQDRLRNRRIRVCAKHSPGFQVHIQILAVHPARSNAVRQAADMPPLLIRRAVQHLHNSAVLQLAQTAAVDIGTAAHVQNGRVDDQARANRPRWQGFRGTGFRRLRRLRLGGSLRRRFGFRLGRLRVRGFGRWGRFRGSRRDRRKRRHRRDRRQFGRRWCYLNGTSGQQCQACRQQHPSDRRTVQVRGVHFVWGHE